MTRLRRKETDTAKRNYKWIYIQIENIAFDFHLFTRVG